MEREREKGTEKKRLWLVFVAIVKKGLRFAWIIKLARAHQSNEQRRVSGGDGKRERSQISLALRDAFHLPESPANVMCPSSSCFPKPNSLLYPSSMTECVLLYFWHHIINLKRIVWRR